MEGNRILKRLIQPFDKRFDLSNRLHRIFVERLIPKHARHPYFCFGGITFFLFIIQVITGIILTSYYVPSTEKAYASVYYITYKVNYGWLIRSIHRWGANLMVMFIFLHMIRVFATASYKHPREYNWVAGVVLFMTTLSFLLTGHLLSWDQKAYWGSTVIIGLAERVPLLGKPIAYILMGGEKIGGATLIRSFSAHIMVLPVILTVFSLLHFWMIRKQGISEPL